jgi:hypothetical protein
VDKETEGRREREGIKRERAKERENIGRKNSAGTGSEREREGEGGGREKAPVCVLISSEVFVSVS